MSNAASNERTGAGRHVWIDASAGVAGDMLLGALLDAGAPLEAVQSAVDAVIPGAIRLVRTEVTRAGQRSAKVDVLVLTDDLPLRHWRTIRTMVDESGLDPRTKLRALAVFERLALAEGRVHGIDPDEVHFHEVGALDSIADVVGVCAALAELDVATVSAGEVAVGSGRTRVAHGDIGVPVPAVAELAVGWRIRAGGTGELATPTGMALIRELCAVCENLPTMTVDAVGVGAGTKDRDGVPNVTRVLIGHRQAESADDAGDVAHQLDTNVDDMDPRLWPGVLDSLLRAGAADAWLTPILMKKGRPAHTLSVLCREHQAENLLAVIFAETSSIGVRGHQVTKHALARAWLYIEVGGGSVTIKIAHRSGTIVQVTPEFDSVAEVAAARSISPRVLLDQADTAAATAGLAVGAALPATAKSVRSSGSRLSPA